MLTETPASLAPKLRAASGSRTPCAVDTTSTITTADRFLPNSTPVEESTAESPGSSPERLLTIIVINFRSPQLTIDCLGSLAPELAAFPGVHVFVVENGSGDDSARRIGEYVESAGWRPWCSLQVSDTNRGFAGGNNHGIAAAMRAGGAKYFLLLNSDTIVQPDCLARCIGIMDSDPGVGALSCRLLNADGSPQNVCRKFPTPLRCLLAAFSLPWRFPAWFSWADCEDLGWDRNK